MFSQAVAQGGSKNLMISPLSVSLVLSMIKHGLSEKDQEELERIVHLPKDENVLKGCAHRLMDQLKAAGFDVANLVYLNKEYRLNPTYQQGISQCYQSKVVSGTSADDINRWVEEKTRGQIIKMVEQKDLDSFFVALLNAIYFKSSWVDAFSRSMTKPENFHVDDTQMIKVEMMHDERSVDYFENGQCQAIKLPYKNCHEAKMLLILPKKGEHFSSINEAFFDEVNKGMQKQEVRIALPKFAISHEINMKDLLNKMGVSNLFGKPDFTPLVDGEHAHSKNALKDLYVSEVKQKSALEVDEKGTEASTVTMLTVRCESCLMPEPTKAEIIFNRPFMACLVKEETPILMSVIQNPKA